MMKIDLEKIRNKNNENFFGEHFEGFGNQWSALFEKSEDFMDRLSESAQNASVLFTQEINNNKYAGLVYPDNSLIQIMLIVKITEKSNVIESFYPLMEGSNNKFMATGAYAWKLLAEGEMAAETEDEKLINFFNPHFAKDIETFSANEYKTISFAGLAYCIDKVEEEVHTINKGGFYEAELKTFLQENPDKTEVNFEAPKITLGKDLRMLIPRDTTSEFEAVGQIEGISYVDFLGTKVTVLKVNFEHGSNDEFLYCNVYASEKALGYYKPQIGDTINTVLWFTGYFY